MWSSDERAILLTLCLCVCKGGTYCTLSYPYWRNTTTHNWTEKQSLISIIAWKSRTLWLPFDVNLLSFNTSVSLGQVQCSSDISALTAGNQAIESVPANIAYITASQSIATHCHQHSLRWLHGWFLICYACGCRWSESEQASQLQQ